MIENERIKLLNDKPVNHGEYVIYWMQQSQRVECNHALEYAVIEANRLKVSPVVFFGITDNFPEGNERHYRFMLENLAQVESALVKRGIPLVVKQISPEKGIVEISKKAALVVTDRGYLRIQREWRESVAKEIDCSLVQVESDVIVPVETASPKEEYSAGTFRPKITPLLSRFLKPIKQQKVNVPSLEIPVKSLKLSDIDFVIKRLAIDKTVKPVSWLRGGFLNAEKMLDEFIEHKLSGVVKFRNDPSKDFLSHMGPYLHFGQISPIHIALRINEAENESAEIYLEELIVRRELSMNFVYYNKNYDSIECLPDWALKTLDEHKEDEREYRYSIEEFEFSRTHDRYWNAAQKEMVVRGKMHGYMRMYWGKKILEWSEYPKDAYETALYLNNKYSLDGRDPNGFTGVAWCFGKHDRAWGARPVFGKVRYMNAKGLERKFDIDTYCKKVEEYPH